MAATDPDVRGHGGGSGGDGDPPGHEAGEEKHGLHQGDGDGDLQAAATQPAREARVAMLEDEVRHTRTVDVTQRPATPHPGRREQ